MMKRTVTVERTYDVCGHKMHGKRGDYGQMSMKIFGSVMALCLERDYDDVCDRCTSRIVTTIRGIENERRG